MLATPCNSHAFNSTLHAQAPGLLKPLHAMANKQIIAQAPAQAPGLQYKLQQKPLMLSTLIQSALHAQAPGRLAQAPYELINPCMPIHDKPLLKPLLKPLGCITV